MAVRVRRGEVWKIDNVSGCAKILLYASDSVGIATPVEADNCTQQNLPGVEVI
jgi:hypothetical protein